MDHFLKLNKQKGFTLIEVLIGAVLFLIIFMGIFGSYQLSLKVVSQSKNRVIATAVANGEIEKIKIMPYASVGVVGGFPEGIIEPVKTIISNNIEYTIETRIDYIVDSADGISLPDDDCPNDYKKVEIKISWEGSFDGELELVSDIFPDSLAQECLEVGGILYIAVFDAYGLIVSSPLIEVKDILTDEIVKSATPADGEHFFSLPVDTYKIVVSKSGYSSSRTYGVEEITTPEKPHPLVLEGLLTKNSFSIDKTSVFSVGLLSTWVMDYFSDSFSDTSKVFEFIDVEIETSQVVLTKEGDDYLESGYLISIDIIPGNLINWEEFSWNDSEPAQTQILYYVLYFNGTDWVLISDFDLSGNSSGFSVSPIDLSGLSYSQLRVRANFSTSDLNVSPILYDWQISWRESGATSITNTAFHIQGEKIIGLDENEDPVYKYSQEHNSGSTGYVTVSNMEWDLYTFSVDASTGLDLESIEPLPHPIGLNPDTTLSVTMYLGAQNSLFVTIQDIENSEPIFSAAVRLYNTGLSYDETQYTDENGQTYFIPLESAVYNIEVDGPGYTSYSDTVSVSGDGTKIISLQRVE